MGPPATAGERVEHGVGSLSSHAPVSGLQRRNRNSTDLPSFETVAMVPCLDHAMALRNCA